MSLFHVSLVWKQCKNIETLYTKPKTKTRTKPYLTIQNLNNHRITYKKQVKKNTIRHKIIQKQKENNRKQYKTIKNVLVEKLFLVSTLFHVMLIENQAEPYTKPYTKQWVHKKYGLQSVESSEMLTKCSIYLVFFWFFKTCPYNLCKNILFFFKNFSL